MFSMFVDVIDRYRILNSVYRGHVTVDPSHLAAALKIIMHTNYMYTHDHPQRTHVPFDLDLDEVDAAEAAPAGHADPDIGTGCTMDDFALGDKVYAWYHRSWWHGTVVYKRIPLNRITLRFTGSSEKASGFRPKDLKPIDAHR